MGWEVMVSPGRGNPRQREMRMRIGNGAIRFNRRAVEDFDLKSYASYLVYQDGSQVGVAFSADGEGEPLGKGFKDGSLVVAARWYDGPNHSQIPVAGEINGLNALIMQIPDEEETEETEAEPEQTDEDEPVDEEAAFKADSYADLPF